MARMIICLDCGHDITDKEPHTCKIRETIKGKVLDEKSIYACCWEAKRRNIKCVHMLCKNCEGDEFGEMCYEHVKELTPPKEEVKLLEEIVMYQYLIENKLEVIQKLVDSLNQLIRHIRDKGL